MFGYVMANTGELSKDARRRYGAVYCGICRDIRLSASGICRAALSYDMAFLALLLSSLYEPEEVCRRHACAVHPMRSYADNEFIRYAADMNVALAYYKALDDVADEKRLSAKATASVLGKYLPAIRARYPRQCDAIERCLSELHRLEAENCPNPDEPAACFGALMGELFVFREDLWENCLRQTGDALGRFVYLADAAADCRRDEKKHNYNPLLLMDAGGDCASREQYLILTMGRCTDQYERLPLVQDKDILDNILYSGVWTQYRRRLGRKA